MASLEVEGSAGGERSCWEWFNHGAGGDQGRPRHPDDKRDYGFVPARSILGLVPFNLGFVVLMQWYPLSAYFTSTLWTEPVIVVTLTLVPIVYMFLTPLFGMGGPDPGWNSDPPKINYSLSHLIDSRSLTCLMSLAWIYPCTLFWATEFRADWLQGGKPQEGLITYVFVEGGLIHGDWLQVLRRIALLVWHVGFTGLLTITDSTNFKWHLTTVFTFAGALTVHLLGAIAASAMAGAAITFQLLSAFAALVGLVAFILFNQPLECSRRGVGYWYLFAEVWALSFMPLIVPARLLLDEDSSAGAVGVAALVAASSSGVLNSLKLAGFDLLHFCKETWSV